MTMYPKDLFRRVAKSTIARAAAICVLSLAPFCVPIHSLANDAAEGKRIWMEKAQCVECHGWAGDGRGSFHSPGKAPSLRESALTRDQIRMTIQCGRPGTPMPHFDRFAYTDKRCYDMTASDLGDKTPDQATTSLQAYEIDALADYIAFVLKGSGPATREECRAYFKSEAAGRCDLYPEQQG